MFRSFCSRLPRRAWLPLLVVVACVALGSTASTQRQRFYRDDPISREPESQDASGASNHDIKSIYEMTYNLFITRDHIPSGERAKNINTIDEVPDSNWFTNRIGTTPITTDQIMRGANVGAPPDPSKGRVLGTSKMHKDGEIVETDDAYYVRRPDQDNRIVFTLKKELCGKPIPREEVLKLFETGRTDLIPGFMSKRGMPFGA